MPRVRWSFNLLPALVICLAAAALAIRIAAPSDLWDHTQPRTTSYTADMLTRGGSAWILAKDAACYPATKPPLYNWLAAPAVAMLGRGSEFAHKAPSLLAAAATLVLIVRLGNRITADAGWLAALAWIACAATCKLAYLARPDMLLSLILFVGWIASVRVLAPRTAHACDGNAYDEQVPARMIVAFWAAIVLAAWDKGPVAVVLPMFAVVASFAVHRSWRPLLRLRPAWGIPCVLLLAPGWYAAVAFIDYGHLVNALWNDEIYGRLTGLGPEGGQRGFRGTLRGLPYMTLYYLTRFAPWSIAATLGAAALVDRRYNGGVARWRSEPRGTTLVLAAIWTMLIIAIFSLSSGKRADYISPALPPAALLAGWWLMRDRFSPVRRAPWLASLLAAMTIGIIGYVDWIGPVYTAETTRRFDEITSRVHALPRDLPLVVVAPQFPHWAILEGTPTPCENTRLKVNALLAGGQALRVLIANGHALSEANERVKNGNGELLWSVEQTREARDLGYDSPICLFELRPDAPPSGR